MVDLIMTYVLSFECYNYRQTYITFLNVSTWLCIFVANLGLGSHVSFASHIGLDPVKATKCSSYSYINCSCPGLEWELYRDDMYPNSCVILRLKTGTFFFFSLPCSYTERCSWQNFNHYIISIC